MTRPRRHSFAGRYAPLVCDAAWRRWTLATGLTRLPHALASLGLVLAGRYATGSYADGALLAGVYAVAESLAAPALGRRLDRVERRGGLQRGLAGASIALAALMLGVAGHASLPLLLVGTVAAAVLPSAVHGGLRAYLPELVGARSPLAFALDASLIELEWLIAPALVAAVSLLGVPYLAVAAMLAATVAGLLATRLLPPLRLPAPPRGADGSSAWRNAGAIRCYLLSVASGYTEGSVTVALAPLLVMLGAQAGIAGFLLVALGVSSAIGGLVFTAAKPRLPGGREQHAGALLAGLGILAVPVALAPTPFLAAVAVTAFGTLIAPINGLRTQLLSAAVPAAQQSEAFSILWAAHGIGWGISGFAVGILIGLVGVRDAVVAAALVAAVSALALRFQFERSASSGGRETRHTG